MKTLTEHEAISDAQIVELSLTGNRDAFAQIITRYQSLICGIAYSACGDVGRSEDLAQDTFVAAWKDLPALKERSKLKHWLCGILRNLINSSRRHDSRTPAGISEPLHDELPSENASPDEHAMSTEEEALVWRALETIPDDYREPLVLFYREGRSARAVAEALELSEEAVRQRLSRGRVMLNERVASTVENVLVRSAPGKAFVVAVMGVLPALSISAKAATLGASAAKSGSAAKAAAATGLLGAILGPVLGFVGMWFGYQESMSDARTDDERAFAKASYKRLAACVVGLIALGFVLMCFQPLLNAVSPNLFTGLMIALLFAYTSVILSYSVWTIRTRRRLFAARQATGVPMDDLKPPFEYRSKWELLGLPLIHIRSSDNLSAPVKAWIASGNTAFGLIFAFGGLAVAPISIGGCAIGLLSFGGLGVGALALGGAAIGVWSFGGFALGWEACGGCAIAWHSAVGGIAVAKDFALGGSAQAAQANNEIAAHAIEARRFFHVSQWLDPRLGLLNAIWFVPVLVQFWVFTRRRKVSAAAKLAVFIILFGSLSATMADDAQTIQPAPEEAPSARFDELVRDDQFKGMFEADRVAFDRAMKLCADTLAKDPEARRGRVCSV